MQLGYVYTAYLMAPAFVTLHQDPDYRVLITWLMGHSIAYGRSGCAVVKPGWTIGDELRQIG